MTASVSNTPRKRKRALKKLLIGPTRAIFTDVLLQTRTIDGIEQIVKANECFDEPLKKSSMQEVCSIIKDLLESELSTGNSNSSCKAYLQPNKREPLVDSRDKEDRGTKEVFLEYGIQHRLLNSVQQMLEAACFEHASRWNAKVLQAKNVSCAEAAELGVWPKILKGTFENLPEGATSFRSSQDFHDAIHLTLPMRHAAVHRERVSVRRVVIMLDAASRLLQGLKNAELETRLESFRTPLQHEMQEVDTKNDQANDEFNSKMSSIQERRRILDLEEREAKNAMTMTVRANMSGLSKEMGPRLHALLGFQALQSNDEMLEAQYSEPDHSTEAHMLALGL